MGLYLLLFLMQLPAGAMLGPGCCCLSLPLPLRGSLRKQCKRAVCGIGGFAPAWR
jgi:hypothetical protein